MRFQFIGRGAALNPKEGSNSVFYREGNSILIIDAGESTFSRLIEYGLLEGIDRIDVITTHTHSDHIGSLGSLIHYGWVRMQHLQTNIVIDSTVEYADNLAMILNAYGVYDEMFRYITPAELCKHYEGFSKLEFVPTDHAPTLKCYGIRFTTPDGTVYFTGDSRDAELLADLYAEGSIDMIYTDTHNDNHPISVHMPLEKLIQIFPPEFRHKVCCMHFGNDATIEAARDAGFTIAENYTSSTKF